MKILILLLLMTPALGWAGRLYEWTDASGETRFGSRPPAGVTAKPVQERLDRLREKLDGAECRELLTPHLRLIDAEIERVRALRVGFGPEFDFTPEARQSFINELLAHRSALLTGREPDDFMPNDKRGELRRLKDRYGQDVQGLRDQIERQSARLQQAQIQLDTERRQAELVLAQYRNRMPFGLCRY